MGGVNTAINDQERTCNQIVIHDTIIVIKSRSMSTLYRCNIVCACEVTSYSYIFNKSWEALLAH